MRRYDILKIILWILLPLTAAGCSDGFDAPSFGGVDADGTVEVTLSVPPVQTVSTRAVDEKTVERVTVLVVYGGSNTVFQVSSISDVEAVSETHSGADATYKISFRLDPSLRGKDNLNIYFIANLPEDKNINIAPPMPLSDVKKLNAPVASGGCMVMSGKSKITDVSTKCVVLKRNDAKITVEHDGGGEGSATTPLSYAIVGNKAVSPLLAGAEDILGTPDENASLSEDFSVGVRYLSPADNNNHRDKSYMIVKAPFEGSAYYYRLDFRRVKTESDGTPTFEYVDLLPNHWYQVKVLEVSRAGYATPAEASKHLNADVRYEIHDHAPSIYNMASDGIRELGVSHEVRYENGDNAAGTWSEERIYVKFFSKDVEDVIPGILDLKNMVTTEDDTWFELNFDGAEDVTDNQEFAGSDGIGSDGNDLGKVYAIPVAFRTTAQTGTLETAVNVKWLGLERTIPVIWERKFEGSQLGAVSLTMHHYIDGLSTTNIEDYWAFLSSTDGGAPASEGLWGIQPERNNGKIRNRGLHFPVMYGYRTGSGPAGEGFSDYSYDFTLAPEIAPGSCKWKFSLEGDDAITKYVKIKPAYSGGVEYTADREYTSSGQLNFTVTRAGNGEPGKYGVVDNDGNDYAYGVGTLVLSISPDNGTTWQTYSLDLYHTGFFHKDGQSHRVDVKDDSNYYYYEVVPIYGVTRTRYWLDRNLGAKSAGMYVEATGGVAYYGDKDAAGGYYKVARKVTNYEDPKMYDEQTAVSDRVSPPGYRVPKQKVWDALRNSDKFVTALSGNYFTSYYDTGVDEIGPVYFPKSMMMNGPAKGGESRSGYYWTQTPATGTEKEEIGRWLKMLMVSGTSDSYINGRVEEDGYDSYGASVRCVNDIEDADVVNRISFNVKGATHVYLYSLSKDASGNEVRIPATAWPGYAIGDYNTMKNGWFNFSMETPDFTKDNLYVVFNFMESDGVIHSMSRGNGGVSLYSTVDAPRSLDGWKVYGDNGNGLKGPDKDGFVAGVPTRLGYWWDCSFDKTGKSSTVYCYKDVKSQYYIYWPVSRGQNIHLLKDDGIDITTATGSVSEIFGYYKYSFKAALVSDDVLMYKNDGNNHTLGQIGSIFREGDDGIFRGYIGGETVSGHPGIPTALSRQASQPDMKRVFCVASDSEPYVYVWEGGDNNKWPGEKMDKDSFTGIYYKDIPTRYNNVIFNKGSNSDQTGELVYQPDAIYNYNTHWIVW